MPLAECTSTPSKPAATARRAASAKSATVARTSSAVISRGTAAGRCPCGVKIVSGSGTGEGATGVRPVVAGWLTRPPCWSCRNIRPPPARTASVTRRQPATCRSVWIAVMFGYVCPTGFGVEPSAMISPAVARWA